jgi:hypothetical protein
MQLHPTAFSPRSWRKARKLLGQGCFQRSGAHGWAVLTLASLWYLAPGVVGSWRLIETHPWLGWPLLVLVVGLLLAAWVGEFRARRKLPGLLQQAAIHEVSGLVVDKRMDVDWDWHEHAGSIERRSYVCRFEPTGSLCQPQVEFLIEEKFYRALECGDSVHALLVTLDAEHQDVCGADFIWGPAVQARLASQARWRWPWGRAA